MNRRVSLLPICECRARLNAAILVAERARPYEAGGFASETWLLWATFKSVAKYRVGFSAVMPSHIPLAVGEPAGRATGCAGDRNFKGIGL